MIQVIKVNSKSKMREFVNFPLKLYKGNPYYCPPFYSDELALYDPKKKSPYAEYSDSVFFLAYKDYELAGRLGVIINHAYNRKMNELAARFTRFECVQDFDVAEALFEAAEKFVRDNNLTRVYGPLGYTDLDREGLLVEGFDCCSCYGSSYNFDYYQTFIERLGYQKHADWIERRIKVPAEPPKKSTQFADIISEKYHLSDAVTNETNIKPIIKKYGKEIFELVNVAYADLEGTIPITDRVRDATLKQLGLLFKPRYISIIKDDTDRVVGFGAVLPSMWHAMNKCKGKLFPFGWAKILRALKRFNEVELALIAVLPEYKDKGLTALIMHRITCNAIEDGIEYAETNGTLETNLPINNVFEKYEHVKHKRKRCYYKDLV